MLPARLQGNGRDEGSQPLRSGCSFGAGHSLGFPVRRDLGWDHARNQSLQLSFLGSGVELKQAEMAANQPDKEDADLVYLVTWFLSLSFLYLGNRRPGDDAGDAERETVGHPDCRSSQEPLC